MALNKKNILVFFYLLIQGLYNGIIRFQFHDIILDLVLLYFILLIDSCMDMGFLLSLNFTVLVSYDIYRYSI